MELRAAARLTLVSFAAVGVLAVAHHLSGGAGDAGGAGGAGGAVGAGDRVAAGSSVAPRDPSGDARSDAPAASYAGSSALRRLESALQRSTAGGATVVVDESQPHTHVVDPETGGLVSVTGLDGVVPRADDLGPIHADPLPNGVDLSDPTDTRTLLRKAGVAASTTPDNATDPAEPGAAAAVVPPGTSSVDGLGAHVSPSCSGTGTDGKRVQALYVRETGTPSRFSSVLPVLRNEVANVDDVFAASAEQTGGVRRVRWVHDAACAPVITEVVLPTGSLGEDWGTTVRAMSAAGYKSDSRKYLMFADARVLCGIGSVYTDTRSGATNNNNVYGGYARVDTSCWSTSNSVAAHELTHNFGGVQGNAPHATANGHCYDESDLMCYVDAAGVTMQQVCDRSQEDLLDCNKDDYFNTAPPSSSYLATSWNVASSAFLDRVVSEPTGPTPPPTPPTVTVTSSGSTAQTGDRVTFSATASSASTWSWSGAAGCTLTAGSASAAAVVCPASVTGDVTVTARATDTATGAVGTGSATVAMSRAAAPTATVTAPASATAGTSFPVSVAASGKPTLGYAWTAGPCTVAAPTSTSTSVTCPADLPAQVVPVEVAVQQADGQRTTGTATVSVTAPATTTPTPPTSTPSTWTAPVLRHGVLWAALRSSGTAVAGAPVTLQVQWRGTSSYVDLRTLTTDQYGRAAARIAYSYAGTYRYVSGESVSPGTYVRVATRAVAHVPRRKVVGGTLSTLTGERIGNATVVLHRRTSGSSRWVTVASARTSSTGEVAVAVRPRRLSYYRWSYAGASWLVGSTSASVSVRP